MLIETLLAPTQEGLTPLEQLHSYSRQKCSKEKVPFGVGVDTVNDKVLLSKFYCNQWDCPACAARLARRWVARTILGVNGLGGDWYFLTLTCGSKARGEKSLPVLRAGWRAFYTCLDALFETRKQQPHYTKVWEQQRDGTFHIHALIDVILSKRWTKDTAVYAGLGHQADWRQVDNAGQVAGYMAKYTLKNIETARAGVQWPKYLHRIQCSENWPKMTKFTASDSYEWIIKLSREAQLRTAEIYRQHGFSIIDKVNTEE